MIIALLETNIYWEDKEKNIKKVKDDIERIMYSYDVDLICLPEMSFTGFSMSVEKTMDVNNETIERMKEFACNYNTGIAFGWVESKGSIFLNHYSLVDKSRVLLDYVKIHPFSYGGEADVFAGGDELGAVRMSGFTVAFQICYDLRFPELFQILSKQADLIIVPANWPSKREDHWDVLLHARAIESQVYIAGVNCKGCINEMEYPGNSCLIAPDGKDVESIDVATINGDIARIYYLSNDVKKYRESFPVKKDRREDLYKRLY
ncbi:MAG: carbon-nitrogen family hydrolase [Lachnospiraceae bacterium]|nr:carbon-nitrogen family hydrolase [Lachnospiraceae bacterium]